MATGWLVYILRCADGTLYTGITTDLERRIASHARGTASKYTRARLPVTIVHQERRRSRSDALRREAAIKRLSRKEKLLIGSSPKTAPERPAPSRPRS